MGCDFPEHHHGGSGVDWLFWALVAAVGAVAAWLVWSVTQALGKAGLVAVLACVLAVVGRGVVAAVVGSFETAEYVERRGGELPAGNRVEEAMASVVPSAPAPAVVVGPGKRNDPPKRVVGPTVQPPAGLPHSNTVPVPAVDELAVRRARRVA